MKPTTARSFGVFRRVWEPPVSLGGSAAREIVPPARGPLSSQERKWARPCYRPTRPVGLGPEPAAAAKPNRPTATLSRKPFRGIKPRIPNVRQIMNQPTPKVSRADVERIVRRDYGAGAVRRALAILDEYCGDNDAGRSRVQLAVLKLASGSEEKLRQEIEKAKFDYRDVLGPAEYPAYHGGFPRLSKEERMKFIDADWRQYTEWLNR